MFAVRARGYNISREMAEMGGMRSGIPNSRRNRCCSRRGAYSSAPSRLVQLAAGPRATCWPHGALQAARDNRAKSRAMSASPPASASSMCRGSDATQRRRSAPSMESGGSARNLKLGGRAGGNRNRDALAWDDLRSTGNGYAWRAGTGLRGDPAANIAGKVTGALWGASRLARPGLSPTANAIKSEAGLGE